MAAMQGAMLTVADIETRLRAAASVLPGRQAQMVMEPRPRGETHPPSQERVDGRTSGSRRAAALLLVYPEPVEAHVLLTVRAMTLPQHAGQVSLPGGAVADGETAQAGALREAYEEVGVDPSQLQVVAPLSTVHITVSRFRVEPFVAVADTPLTFRPDPREVGRLLEVPVSELLDPARVHVTHWLLHGRDCDIPYFDLGGEIVWGATAMILAEFVQLLKK
ncbi:MAG: NUDIX domain-containing protein [Luteitalea sp.]|nr:NUDIX domain-containing protein [Luteitalea sp.]